MANKKTTKAKATTKKPVAKKSAAKKTSTKPAAKTTKKKPVAKKSASVKKPVAKKAVAKKPVAKKPTSKKTAKKKPVAKVKSANSQKKQYSSSKKTTSRANLNTNKESKAFVYINHKKYILPKRELFETYSCIKRMYLITDPITQEQKQKRYWIVIGDGHKRYRKFETQREAINYFRQLKKYANMRVQSVESNKFVRTIYTFFEMAWSGIDINYVEDESTTKTEYETEDFKDEYSKYETKEINHEGFDEEQINKVITESEHGAVILEETNQYSFNSNNDYNFNDNESSKNDDDKYTSEIIFANEHHNRVDDDSEQNFFKLTDESKPRYSNAYVDIPPFYEDPTAEVDKKPFVELVPEIKTEEKMYDEYVSPNENQKKSLYDLAVDDVKEEIQTQYVNVWNNNNDDDDMSITQHQTSLTPVVDDAIDGGVYHNNLKIIYWLIVFLICALLATIVVLSLCLAGGVI